MHLFLNIPKLQVQSVVAFWFCFVFKKVDENHFPKLTATTITHVQKQDSSLIQEIFLLSFLFYEYIYNRCIIFHYPGLKVTGWGLFFFPKIA